MQQDMNPAKALLLSLGLQLFLAVLSTPPSSDADPRSFISVVEGKPVTIFKGDPLNSHLSRKLQDGGDGMAGSDLNTAVMPGNAPSDHSATTAVTPGRKQLLSSCGPTPKHKPPSSCAPNVSSHPQASSFGGLTISVKITITVVCISIVGVGVLIGIVLKLISDYIKAQYYSTQPQQPAGSDSGSGASAGGLTIIAKIKIRAGGIF